MKLNRLMSITAAATLLASCGGNGGGPVDPNDNPLEVNKAGTITSNETWSTDSIYVLNGRVVVDANAVLTIEPGTIVKGAQGDGANASALIIAQGGQLNATGTANAPIIFTSELDNIDVGEFMGTNLDETDNGLWGGLIVLGNAPISADASTARIEGLPANETYGFYGGTDGEDNSGTLEYISIRHGGALLGEGNEINGLTLGGVGSATTVNQIEIVGNVDDGIECFGGTVNVSNIVVWAQGDDAYDIDQAYSGTINNFIYVAGPDSDHGLEIDGPEGTTGAGFTMSNGTMYGGAAEIADFRDSAMGSVSNVFISGFGDAGDWEIDESGSAYNFSNQMLNFASIEIDMSGYSDTATLNDVFVDASGQISSWDPSTFATAVTTATIGADESVFAWTYASQNDAF